MGQKVNLLSVLGCCFAKKYLAALTLITNCVALAEQAQTRCADKFQLIQTTSKLVEEKS